MSEEQLSALLAKLQVDAGLKEKLKGATDLDAAVVVAQEAGFDVTRTDWLKYQDQNVVELSDEELEIATGGADLQRIINEVERLPEPTVGWRNNIFMC